MIEIPEDVIITIRRMARFGQTTGRDQLPHERHYIDRCSHFHWHTGTVLLFTRDVGHHTSGWMKNPEFERCMHLSLSFRVPTPERTPDSLASIRTLGTILRSQGQWISNVPFDDAMARAWVKAILGEDRKLAWEEGPFSGEGKTLGVRHWRVFCDKGWNPIMPHGEVYSRDMTEKGWKSWSEQQGDQPNWISAE